MKGITILATFAVAVSAFSAPGGAPPALSLVKSAEASAHQEHKNVMLIFHASWCGWCHKYDDFLTNPKIAPLINSSYEIVHVDVLEQPEKKGLENDGGEAMLEQYGGKDQGIPFIVILSPNNKVLATSLKPGAAGAKPANIGYPGEPDEIAYFMGMLKQTSRLSGEQQYSIKTWLVQNKPATH